MSKDKIDKLLDDAINGRTLFKNREILQSSHTPHEILYRDDEQKRVMQALLPLAKRARPSNLLVYGKTGTGKTLVVRDTLKKIQEHPKLQTFPIRILYSNAKEESTPSGLLVSFGRQLGFGLELEDELPSTGLSIGSIFNKLINVIKKESLKAIFVIDEIDDLVKTKHTQETDVLYLMTRANTRTEQGFISIIGISNVLDFKEKLDPRVVSSLSEEEIVFKPYTVSQIKKILSSRIKEAFVNDTVEEAALNLCSAIAGQEHGDARRAIDLLRVAGELAEREGSMTVTEEYVRNASIKMEEDKDATSLNSLPLHQKILTLAVMRANGSTTGEIYLTYKSLCKTIRQKELTQRRATQILGELEESTLITGKIISQGIHGRTKKYSTTIPPEKIKKAFVDDLSLQDLL
jgi:archaeal cell division control protein 6